MRTTFVNRDSAFVNKLCKLLTTFFSFHTCAFLVMGGQKYGVCSVTKPVSHISTRPSVGFGSILDDQVQTPRSLHQLPAWPLWHWIQPADTEASEDTHISGGLFGIKPPGTRLTWWPIWHRMRRRTSGSRQLLAYFQDRPRCGLFSIERGLAYSAPRLSRPISRPSSTVDGQLVRKSAHSLKFRQRFPLGTPVDA